jgi:calcineurin-like phosphoesterase family protein
MDLYTADTHFDHDNIRRYCARIYGTVEEMNESLIRNWNAKVKPEDMVYHVGDFGFGQVTRLVNIRRRLNGKILLIYGNHDKHKDDPAFRAMFEDVVPYYEQYIEDEEMDYRQPIIMCHYAFEVWNKRHFGSWHLHGHSHGTLPSPDWQSRLDVGVDANGMAPLTYDEVKQIMTKKVFKPLDQHTVRVRHKE